MSVQGKDACISCKEAVRTRQEGLQCDGCDRWQHRTCNSGVSQKDYRAAVQSRQDIDWRCVDCLNMSAGILLPVAESTRIVKEQNGKVSSCDLVTIRSFKRKKISCCLNRLTMTFSRLKLARSQHFSRFTMNSFSRFSI